MLDVATLGVYFPNVGKTIISDNHSFTVQLNQEESTFILEIYIKQKDTKEDELIKFRMGIAKDALNESQVHITGEPHFEVDLYKRGKNACKTQVYLTFYDYTNDSLESCAKGTVVAIKNVLQKIIAIRGLSISLMNELIYVDAVEKELASYHDILLNELHKSYQNNLLTQKTKDFKKIVISTPRQLDVALNVPDLQSLYLPLRDKLR